MSDVLVLEVTDPQVVVIESQSVEVVTITSVGPRGPQGPAGIGFDVVVTSPEDGDVITYISNVDQWQNRPRETLVDGGNF